MAVTVPFAIAVAVAAVALFAVGPSHAQKTECQRGRDRNAGYSTSLLLYECDAEGDFVPLQPTRHQQHVCVTPKEGDLVSPPSRRLQTCVCPLAAHAAKRDGEETVPQCDATGRFRPMQIQERGFVCVDPNTREVTKGPGVDHRPLHC